MHLLIAYDGSSPADAALADLHKAGLPPRCQATVLSVADVWLPGMGTDVLAAGIAMPPDPVTVRQCADLAMREARTIASRGRDIIAASFPDWTIAVETTGDSPAWSIIRLAEQLTPDLVVMGSHGRGALGRMLLGSVSTRVLDELRLSVRIGREPKKHDGTRVIVGVDGSPDSDAAVRIVRESHWPSGTQIKLVVGANWRLYSERIADTAQADAPPEAWGQHVVRRAHEQLANTTAEVILSVRSGDAKRVLLDEAESWQADCIYLGARGLSRAERWLLGSVSMSVATHASCSVQIVHAR